MGEMLGEMEENGDKEINFLTDYNVGWDGKDGIGASTIDEHILYQEYFLVDTAPIAYSRVVADKIFDDITVACRTLFDGSTFDQKKDPR